MIINRSVDFSQKKKVHGLRYGYEVDQLLLTQRSKLLLLHVAADIFSRKKGWAQLILRITG
jgi:hypothetical protein